jgi:hypothetical protein
MGDGEKKIDAWIGLMALGNIQIPSPKLQRNTKKTQKTVPAFRG